ncbi:hypothetical protein M9458_055931, partial [Cirrhinus mrigala]
NVKTLDSMGVSDTECVVLSLSFEIVETSQSPLLSGSTCEHLGLMQFTIPDEELKMEHEQYEPLTKAQLINKHSDVHLPVESLGEVHFELIPVFHRYSVTPQNVPIAMKAAVKAQLDAYQAEGLITDVTEPTDWISNMVIVKKTDKLRICLDPKFLNKALIMKCHLWRMCYANCLKQ